MARAAQVQVVLRCTLDTHGSFVSEHVWCARALLAWQRNLTSHAANFGLLALKAPKNHLLSTYLDLTGQLYMPWLSEAVGRPLPYTTSVLCTAAFEATYPPFPSTVVPEVVFH